MTITELSDNLQSTIDDLDQLIDRAVFDNQEEIIDLNTAQLSKGRDSSGDLLEAYRSESYAEYKQFIGSNAPTGIADLKLEGDFYSGFTLEKEGEDYVIYSQDEKNDDLIAKYGAEIFGLTNESIEKLSPDLTESVLTELRKSIGI